MERIPKNAKNPIAVGTYVLYCSSESAPLLREREVFLEHLLQQGTSIAAARCVSWQLLNVIRLLKLTRLRGVRIDEIEEAAKKWTRQQRLAKFACQHIE